ncbi:MAG: glycosyltransferase family 4 protein, partial [Anaerolineales bacterium]|nr:glycosyltransferase family 4 protein [Anaerolineales bacterium]
HNVEAGFILPFLRLRYKVISTSHGAAQVREKWGSLAKALIRSTEYPFLYLSNFVTSVSQPLAERYEREYKQPVSYIANGVSKEVEYDLEGARAVLQLYKVKPGNYLMFSAGRILPSKGGHLILEAFSKLDSNINLIVVGDPKHMPEYTKKLHDMADDRVRFIDFVADKAVLFGLIKMTRLFIFPSTYEAMSMMLLEVASLNIPVLCSDIPENVSVLPELARFFKSNDAEDLYVQLVKALAEPEQMVVLAERAHEWVNNKHQWSTIVQEYVRLYDAV